MYAAVYRQPSLRILLEPVEDALYPLEINPAEELFPFFFGPFRIVLEIFFEFGYFHIYFDQITLVGRESSGFLLFQPVVLLAADEKTRRDYQDDKG